MRQNASDGREVLAGNRPRGHLQALSPTALVVRAMDDRELRLLFAGIPVNARYVLRRAARADQWERDELAYRLWRETGGALMGEIVDRMSLNADLRQQVVRTLGALEAEHNDRPSP